MGLPDEFSERKPFWDVATPYVRREPTLARSWEMSDGYSPRFLSLTRPNIVLQMMPRDATNSPEYELRVTREGSGRALLRSGNYLLIGSRVNRFVVN